MYIKETIAISPQNTLNNDFFEKEPINHKGLIFTAIEPKYTDFIPRKLLRRMGKAVRMGIGAGIPILNKHKNIDGIIIGTANGGINDSLKFLNQIVDYDEGTLTPTNFIQSTPNSIAGVLAQMSNCSGYNNTHTNEGLSFEGAIMDAKLLFLNKEVKSLLLGAVEEVSQYNHNLELLQDTYKEEEIDAFSLLKSNTKGTVNGEGATMFYLESNNKNAIAKIEDLTSISFPDNEDLLIVLKEFLKTNNLDKKDIDTLVSGRSGDNRQNKYYKLIEKEFEHSNVFTFKNLIGEYPTVSAFAVWLSCQIFLEKKIPTQIFLRNKKRKNKHILIYNLHKNRQHSFILLSKCA